MARKRSASIEQGFLADICAHPADDTSRLIFADWLEENGQPDRAEFIRVQVRLANLAPDDPERDDLADREYELLLRHEKEWRGGLPVVTRKASSEFSRGFIGSVSLMLKPFLLADKLLARVPIEKVHIRDLGSDMADLAACPHLAQIRVLDLRWNTLFADDLEILFRSPHLQGLRSLILSSCRLSGDALARLARCPGLARISELILAQNPVSFSGIEQLLTSPYLTGVRRLCLHVPFGDALGQCLARCRNLATLEHLDVSTCRIGAEGWNALGDARFFSQLASVDASLCASRGPAFQAFAASPLVRQLINLNLANNQLTAEDMAWLSRPGQFDQLRSLSLGPIYTPEGLEPSSLTALVLPSLRKLCLPVTRLGPDAATALARNADLAGLRELDLEDNILTNEGVLALADSPNLANLRRLRLANNALTSTALECLSSSPHLAQLRFLDLSDNPDLVSGAKDLCARTYPPSKRASGSPASWPSWLGGADRCPCSALNPADPAYLSHYPASAGLFVSLPPGPSRPSSVSYLFSYHLPR